MRHRLASMLVSAALGTSVFVATAPSAVAKPAIPGVSAEITLRTPEDGVGRHPTLRWKAARDAESYVVVVQTRKGDPYWTWQGDKTSVRLGGGKATKRSTQGAELAGRHVWFVLGLDADGAVVAASAKRPIKP